MAAKYQRRLTWWVRFYHSRTGDLIRASLNTHDEARAELLRQRIELETALLAPRFQAADIPAGIQTMLGTLDRTGSKDGVAPLVAPVSPVSAGPPRPTGQRQPLDRALQTYMAHIRSDNAALHIENKVSILRRFLGDERVLNLLAQPGVQRRLLPSGVCRAALNDPAKRGVDCSERRVRRDGLTQTHRDPTRF